LTCAHHPKQLWSAKDVWFHFMKHKHAHSEERAEIRAEIDNPSNEEDQRDEAVLAQYYGKGEDLLCKWSRSGAVAGVLSDLTNSQYMP
jgi:hypothetical protein